MLTGFEGPVERAYVTWLARHCTGTLMLWRPIFLFLQLVTIIKGARTEGMTTFLADLPSHLVMSVPQVVGIVLMMKKQYR
jgi:hypothetical protein